MASTSQFAYNPNTPIVYTPPSESQTALNKATAPQADSYSALLAKLLKPKAPTPQGSATTYKQFTDSTGYDQGFYDYTTEQGLAYDPKTGNFLNGDGMKMSSTDVAKLHNTYTTSTAQSPWLGKEGYLNTGAAVASALYGAYGAYQGGKRADKELDLAEQQFNLQRDSANASMLANVDQYNNTQANRSGIAQAMSGMSETDWKNNASAQSQFAKLDANKYRV